MLNHLFWMNTCFVTPAEDPATKDAHETTATESWCCRVPYDLFVLCNSNSSKVCFVHCAFCKEVLVNSFKKSAATFYFTLSQRFWKTFQTQVIIASAGTVVATMVWTSSPSLQLGLRLRTRLTITLHALLNVFFFYPLRSPPLPPSPLTTTITTTRVLTPIFYCYNY